MSPNGAVTRGFLFNGRRWAAAKGAGLVDLKSAARLSQDATKPAPRILAAIDALGAGASPTDLALVLESSSQLRGPTLHSPLRTSTLIHCGAVYLDWSVGDWRHLEAMRARGDPLLGGRLLDLAPFCHDALPACAERVAMLRLARLAVTKRISEVPGAGL